MESTPLSRWARAPWHKISWWPVAIACLSRYALLSSLLALIAFYPTMVSLAFPHEAATVAYLRNPVVGQLHVGNDPWGEDFYSRGETVCSAGPNSLVEPSTGDDLDIVVVMGPTANTGPVYLWDCGHPWCQLSPSALIIDISRRIMLAGVFILSISEVVAWAVRRWSFHRSLAAQLIGVLLAYKLAFCFELLRPHDVEIAGAVFLEYECLLSVPSTVKIVATLSVFHLTWSAWACSSRAPRGCGSLAPAVRTQAGTASARS